MYVLFLLKLVRGPLCTCVWGHHPLWRRCGPPHMATQAEIKRGHCAERSCTRWWARFQFSRARQTNLLALSWQWRVSLQRVLSIITSIAHEDTHLHLPWWDSAPLHGCFSFRQARRNPIVKSRMVVTGWCGREGAVWAPCNQLRPHIAKGELWPSACTRLCQQRLSLMVRTWAGKVSTPHCGGSCCCAGGTSRPQRGACGSFGALYPAKLAAGPRVKACHLPKATGATRGNGAPRSSKANRI